MADIKTGTLRIGSNNLVLQDDAARGSLAPAYSASSTYAVGDMVLKDGQLYECNTAISTAEAWTAAHWTAVTVGNELTDLKDDLTKVETNLYDAQTGILNDYLLDQVILDNTGYPKNYTGSVSYSGKTNSTSDMPFYKTRPIYNQWYPSTNLSNTFRYMLMTPPSSVSGQKYTISFWVKNDLTTNKTFKFGILPSRNAFDSLTALAVGYTQTVGTAKLVIDAKYGDWYHFTVNVDDSANNNNTTDILLGSNKCNTTDRVSFSPPVIVLGSEISWFIKYTNPSYDPVINPLKGKKLAWRGDSLMAGGADGEGLQGWYGRIVHNNEMIGENKAVSGAIMCHAPSSSYHSISDNCDNFTMQDPDYIILDGGTNDMFNQSICPIGTFNPTSYAEPASNNNYADALEYCFYKLITTYPNAKIGFIIPYRMTVYNENAGGYVSYNTYPNMAKQICEKWGVACLDMREKTTVNYIIPSQQSLMNDFVHVNAGGYNKTWTLVEGWLKSL